MPHNAEKDAPRIGSLFSGYGGLDMGVTAAIGGSVAWHVEFDKAPSKILAHHWPDVPNYGDVTAVDWSQVEPVDVITGGSPCQDLSHAGKRQGMTEGTRSNLWVAIREAIAQLKPRLVVWENVGGAFSAPAVSEVEPCAGCVGDGSGVNLRALHRVLGDLASLGFDAEWVALRAADVGAPHGRLRVFVAAYPRGASFRLDAGAAPRAQAGTEEGDCLEHRGRARTDLTLLSTPQARDYKGVPGDGFNTANLARDVSLLPTPAVNDMGEGKTVEAWDAWTDRMKAVHGNGNGHGKSLSIEAQRLLPTPNAGDAWVPMEATENTMRRGDPNGSLRSTSGSLPKDLGLALHADRWGVYADAIARWESLTRPAPAPTQLSKKGTPQLSPAFSEWLMGLPAGHVTDVPDLSRSDMLKALGNGVVPQQATAAIRHLLTIQENAA